MNELLSSLDLLSHRYHQKGFLESDPLDFVHQYSNPFDQEIVAVTAAVLSYGGVKQIKGAVETLRKTWLDLKLNPSDVPEACEQKSERKEFQRKLKDFRYRFNSGDDLIVLWRLMAQSIREKGSIGEDLTAENGSLKLRLSGLIRRWKAASKSFAPGASFSYLLTDPEDGSVCKRWCMLLRWMGRKDNLDLGLWMKDSPLIKTRGINPAELYPPLDTHSTRIYRYLNLLDRKTLDWKAVEEVRAHLLKLDPKDPIRFDFSVSRLGILAQCKKRYDLAICPNCELFGACRFAKK